MGDEENISRGVEEEVISGLCQLGWHAMISPING